MLFGHPLLLCLELQQNFINYASNFKKVPGDPDFDSLSDPSFYLPRPILAKPFS